MKTVLWATLSANGNYATSTTLAIEGVQVVSSPKEALNYLKIKGHKVALLTGGETLHNTFLAENLVDALIFNFAPVFESEGMHLVLPKDQYKDVSLIEVKDLGGCVIRHRYSIRR